MTVSLMAWLTTRSAFGNCVRYTIVVERLIEHVARLIEDDRRSLSRADEDARIWVMMSGCSHNNLTGYIRHFEVGYDGIDRATSDGVDRVLTSREGTNLVTVAQEHFPQSCHCAGLIIDDYELGHGVALSKERANRA